jgi:hypothetical protein
MAVEVSRPALMSLARDFVNRIGQKMQPPTDPKEIAINQIPEGELLLLQPRLGDQIFVAANIGSIRRQNRLFISFREFCEGLAFPIQVNTTDLTAQGWYLKENFGLNMDLRKNFIVSRGTRYEVANDEWFQQDGEIFVDSKSIEKWMKIESDVIWEAQLIDLAADVPFPLQDRIERRKFRLETADYNPVPVLPRVPNPYRLATPPNAEVAINNTLSRTALSEKSSLNTTINLSAAGDLANHTVRTQTAYSRERGLQNFRATAERRSENADLLGPLQAKQYQVGDVSPVSLPIIEAPDQGWGARFSNATDTSTVGSISRTFEGDIPPEWDVELYDGDQLIALQTSGPTGRFRFENVDLFAGDNDFRLVFYGPQGQIREETVSIPVALNAVGADNRLYDVSLTLNNIETYSAEKSDDPDRGAPSLVVSYQQGISEGLSANAGLSVRQVNNQQKAFANAGVVVRIGETLFNTNLIADAEGQAALENVVRRSFGKHDFRSTSVYSTRNFDPNNNDSAANIFRSATDLRGPIGTFWGYAFNYTLNNEYAYQDSDNNRNDISIGQTARLGRYTIGHALDYTNTKKDSDTTRDVASIFSIRQSVGQTRIRASARYSYSPSSEFDQFTVNISRNLNPNLQGLIDVTYSPDPNLTILTAQMNYQHDQYILSPNLSVDTDDNVRAGVNLSFGLVYDKDKNRPIMTRQLVNNSGAVAAQVFLDRDGNGQFDGQDEPLPDVRITTAQVSRSQVTDADGRALLYNLPEYEPTDVVLDAATLPDPYYVSGFEGSSVFPRPGAPVALNFPVHLSGEIDGTVFRPGLRGIEAASGVRMQLINHRGEVVLSSLTAFDGFYVISVIPPGQYLLRINPDDLARSGLRQPLPRVVRVAYDGRVQAGLDLYLEQGTDIPIAFIQTPKRPDKDSAATNPNIISLELGSYRSLLLAQIMKLRLGRALRSAGLGGLAIATTVVDQDGKTMHQLVTQMDRTQFATATQACNVLANQKLSCGLRLSPSLFLDQQTARADNTPPVVTSGPVAPQG